MTEQMKGVVMTTIGVLAIVPDSLLIRMIDAEIPVIAFWRSGFAGVVLLATVLLIYRRNAVGVVVRLRWSGAIYTVLMACATLLFVVAIEMTSVASTVFIVSTAPVFSAIISRLFLGERITGRMVWTIILSLVGVGVIAFGSVGEPAGQILGKLAALGVALCLSASYTAARSARPFSMVPAAALSQLVLATTLLVFVEPWGLDRTSWIYAVLLGGFLVPLGAGLLAVGPRYITAAEVSLLLLLEAALAPVLVWLVLGEVPTAWVLAGGVFLLTVLAVSNWAGFREARQLVRASGRS
ncbi:MAG: DMT family transporter [Paracoccaceae bacterium]|nr:DMT family transporter [Paracoccaceae bacterium]